jgi:hypothetical protein
MQKIIGWCKDKQYIKLGMLTLLSLSVGSIISVPGTGHDMVGPWNP